MKSVIDRIIPLLCQDKPDWVGSKVLKFLLDNPTFLLTVLYLGISGLGLLYEFVLFSKFGINVLNYSEAADFFLAAFKRPEAYFLALGIASTIVIYRLLADFARRLKTSWRFIIYVIVWIGFLRREILIPVGAIYFFSIYILFAQAEANRIVNEHDTTVTITTRFGQPQEYTLIPIGTTERFIFGVEYDAELLAYRSNSKIEAITPFIRGIPFSNITKIEYHTVKFDHWRFF